MTDSLARKPHVKAQILPIQPSKQQLSVIFNQISLLARSFPSLGPFSAPLVPFHHLSRKQRAISQKMFFTDPQKKPRCSVAGQQAARLRQI